jgi:hypothetical protein
MEATGRRRALNSPPILARRALREGALTATQGQPTTRSIGRLRAWQPLEPNSGVHAQDRAEH